MSILSKISNRLVKALAALWYRLDRRHRETVRRNLAFAFGEEMDPAERERWPGRYSSILCASPGRR